MATNCSWIQFLALVEFLFYDAETLYFLPPKKKTKKNVGLSCLEMVREARWDSISAEK
jgi:hypothetical protein